MAKFNKVELSESTMQATRQHFANICQGCIDEVLSGYVKLPSHTNQETYFEYCRTRAAGHLAGDSDHTLTFLQYAYWIQEGECIALLP